MIAMEKPQGHQAAKLHLARKRRRDPEVFATDCPQCQSDNTRVVRTKRIVRYCKCMDCPTTWIQTPKR
jgi:hypothetical protein